MMLSEMAVSSLHMCNLKQFENFENIDIVLNYLPLARSIAVQYVFHAGSMHDVIPGTAHFLEHMIFDGTDRYSKQEVSEIADDHGFALNAWTDMQNTVYHTICMPDELEACLNLYGHIVSSPDLFNVDSFANEQTVIENEIQRRLDEDFTFVIDKFWNELLFDKSVPGFIIGTVEDLRQLTPEIISKYHKKHYTRKNLSVIISGNLDGYDREKIRDYILASVRELPIGSQRNLVTFDRFYSAITENIYREVAQEYTISLCPLIDVNNEALDIYSTAFGQINSNPISQRIRNELGYSYQVGTSQEQIDVDKHIFYFYCSATPGTNEQVYTEFQSVLNNYVINEASFNRAKKSLLKDYALKLERPFGCSKILREQLMYGEALDLESPIQKLEKITIEDVQHLHKTILANAWDTKVILVKET